MKLITHIHTCSITHKREREKDFVVVVVVVVVCKQLIQVPTPPRKRKN
jgi:hypothetical protein